MIEIAWVVGKTNVFFAEKTNFNSNIYKHIRIFIQDINYFKTRPYTIS